jgi:FkbM family methyltransferase
MKVEAMVTQNNSVDIYIDERKYIVPNHWFWPEFADSWEPQTHTFFERNLKKDTSFLDIGGWIGPTALIATELGAKKVIIVEPNPINFMKLIQIQFSNLGLLERWTLLNVCVANSRGFTQIGPVEGVINSSSATNIRDQSGVEVMSILLTDLIDPKEDYSLIKIDIESDDRWWVVYNEDPDGVCIEPETAPPDAANLGISGENYIEALFVFSEG